MIFLWSSCSSYTYVAQKLRRDMDQNLRNTLHYNLASRLCLTYETNQFHPATLLPNEPKFLFSLSILENEFATIDLLSSPNKVIEKLLFM